MSNRSMIGARHICALSILGGAALFSTTALLGCSANNSETSGAEGQAHVVALALSNADVAHVTLTVAGGGLSKPVVIPIQKKGSEYAGLVSAIPAGTGYAFTIEAADKDGLVIYKGSATSVTVVKGQTVEVVITAQQVNAPTPYKNAAPIIDSLLVSSVNVAPGDSITLDAIAHDPNPGDTLTYAWIARGGTFSAANGASTIWTAPTSTGSYPIMIRVKDQKGTTITTQITITVATKNGQGQAEVTVALNTWPVVTNLVGSPNYLVKGSPTILTAQANDPDNDSLSYTWTSTCAGTFSNTQLPTPSFALDGAATDASCTFSVAVSDNRGGSTTGTLDLSVGAPSFGQPPVITTSSQSLQFVDSADSVVLIVNATDPASTALSYQWSASDGAVANQVDSAGSSQIVWTPPSAAASSWLITATVTDEKGFSSTKTFTVRPSSCFGVQPAANNNWSFAVMSDTQWTPTDDGLNPNSVATDIINQLNSQFIAKGAKFVVAVGDVTDNGSVAALDTRAKFTQALYNAGIGFFPLRGNHESSATAAKEFLRIFPQTQTGLTNASPSDVVFPNLVNADDANTNPVAVTGTPFTVGGNFSSPTMALTGLSYAFDYNNARFVLLDQFTPPTGSAVPIPTQQSWIGTTLAARPTGGHGFVFAHKGLITEDHVDTLFGSNPSSDPAGQDAFITSLAQNGVRYFMGGHDHMHNRAFVTTTDGVSNSVQNIICPSDSSKFYTPASMSNDAKYNVPAFGHTRETEIQQELYTVGYYLVTINDNRATVDFYSAAVNTDDTIKTTPELIFTKRESFGYALNGKQFVVPQGQTYTTVQDSYAGTTARILGGTNAGTAVDPAGRAFVKTVDTGWSSATCATASNVLSLWSTVSTLGSDQTDTYVLSMNYDPSAATPEQIATGLFGLAVQDSNGNWVNAVNKDFGGTKNFVQRAWNSTDSLGTYGVDAASNTAWAVINHSSNFAVARFTN